MIIIGIDPGTATTGFGVVEKISNRVSYVTCGAIVTDKSAPMPERLHAIYTQLDSLLERYQPDVVVTEQLFFGNNVTTAMQVGRAVGVVLLSAAQRGLPWVEYRPVEVKLAVVGYGAAEKKQVQYMVQQLLHLDMAPKPDDAADALALAVCHAHSVQIRSLESQAH